jgi:serine/threonine protein phosphatase PrpC
MGCIVSTGTKSQVVKDEIPILRRRLTLGEIDDEEDTKKEEEVTEGDRSLLLNLTQQQTWDFIQVADDSGVSRRYSIGSKTDSNLNQVASFCSKSIEVDGEKFDAASSSAGYACKKGLKPEAPNQDSFLIMKVEDRYALYGVFDGHGRKGHDVSNFVKDMLPKVLFSQEEFPEDPHEALLRTFAKVQNLIEKATLIGAIDAARSGTTCSVVLHMLQLNMLFIAHVGDSRVVLGKQLQRGEQCVWQSLDLTQDHKPDLPEERERIEKAGGVVVFDGGWNYRVFAKGKRDARGKRYPGLNMSRAMGDLQGFHDAGISACPDIKKRLVAVKPTEATAAVQPAADANSDEGQITERTPSISSHDIDPNTDKFILLCSDGVWEFITSEAAVQEVAKFKKSEAVDAAEHLCACAWDKWIREMDGQVVDDITAVLVHLSHREG